MAADRVFLHIGAPKTGTTYLQHLMAANKDALASQGVLYAAGAYGQDRVWATELLRGHDLAKHPKPHARGAWERILRQVRGWDGSAVVSHEFFGACSADQALRAHFDLAPAELHLVFTARDYVRQASAVWQERLKYGFATPLSEFSLDPGNGTPMWSWRTQDVVAILDRWQHDLPPSRVHVVTVPPPGGPAGELWERFASVIGVEPASCKTQLSGVNTSLGLVEAELLRRVDARVGDRLGGSRVRARWIRDLLANRVLSQGGQERFSVAPAQAAELTGCAQQTVAQLTERGYHVVGSLDDLIPLSAPTTSRLPEDATAEELLDAAVDAIAGLLLESKARADRREGSAARPGGGARDLARSGSSRPGQLAETLFNAALRRLGSSRPDGRRG